VVSKEGLRTGQGGKSGQTPFSPIRVIIGKTLAGQNSVYPDFLPSIQLRGGGGAHLCGLMA
jgi:hypothetical protein